MTCGQMLRAARVSRGHTIEAVSARARCSMPYLSAVERDRRSPLSPAHFGRVAHMLELNPDAFAVAAAQGLRAISLDGLDDAQIEMVVQRVAAMRAANEAICRRDGS